MQSGFRKVGTVLALLGLTATAIGVAVAQGPRGGGRRMGPRMGQGHDMTAANAPLQLVENALKLSIDQRTQILAIQQEFRDAVHDQMPRPPAEGSGPPDRTTMNALMEKVKSLHKTYSAQVVAVLSADQKTALTRFLDDSNDFRLVRIPPPAIPLLQLTGDQWAKVHAIAVKARAALDAIFDKAPANNQMGPDRSAVAKINRDAHESALAVLTDDQKAIVETFNTARRGGPNGPPPGGPDGGPMGPPPGGPNGGF